MNKKLILCVDMFGCPNKCKHCWIGNINHHQMDKNADIEIVNYFKPYFKDISFYSWFREPDYTKDYEQRWIKDNELSINTLPERYELASFYLLNKDKNYVKFLNTVGVKTVQLTFFGQEELTNKYIGRKTAYQELINAINVLIDNQISPRIQMFINEENKDDLVKLLERFTNYNFEEKCKNKGLTFSIFVHEGSCDGENQKLYNIRINKENIPEILIPYYLDYDSILTENECCEQLKDNESYFVYHNEDTIVLYITSDYNVYFNFTNIDDCWKIGNLKTDKQEELINHILNEDIKPLELARKIKVKDLVKEFGDFNSHRVFSIDDYKSYLLNCYIKTN